MIVHTLRLLWNILEGEVGEEKGRAKTKNGIFSPDMEDIEQWWRTYDPRVKH